MTRDTFNPWLKKLRCPECLDQTSIAPQENCILVCHRCHKKYTYTNNFLSMLSSSAYHRGTKRNYEHFFQPYTLHNDMSLLYYGKTADEDLRFFSQEVSAGKISIQDMTILDAGCGIARLARTLARHRAKVVALDIHDHLHQYAKDDISGCTYMQGSLQSIPFSDNAFNIVWCHNALSQTPNLEKSLRELQRVTAKGGKLYLGFYQQVQNKKLFKLTRHLRNKPQWIKSLYTFIIGCYFRIKYYYLSFLSKTNLHTQSLMQIKDWMLPSIIHHMDPKNILMLFPKSGWNILKEQSSDHTMIVAQKIA